MKASRIVSCWKCESCGEGQCMLKTTNDMSPHDFMCNRAKTKWIQQVRASTMKEKQHWVEA